MINVVVGTENPQKRKAIEEAFQRYFDSVEVEMLSVSSDVSKQPIGGGEILRGAENRIRNMKRQRPRFKHWDYLVSVEAGIVHIGKRYYNMQYVMIENTRTGKKSTGISQMLEIPKKYVKLASNTSINNVFRTVLGNNKVDGVSILTRNQADREMLICNGAIMALAGQLNNEMW